MNGIQLPRPGLRNVLMALLIIGLTASCAPMPGPLPPFIPPTTLPPDTRTPTASTPSPVIITRTSTATSTTTRPPVPITRTNTSTPAPIPVTPPTDTGTPGPIPVADPTDTPPEEQPGNIEVINCATPLPATDCDPSWGPSTSAYVPLANLTPEPCEEQIQQPGVAGQCELYTITNLNGQIFTVQVEGKDPNVVDNYIENVSVFFEVNLWERAGNSPTITPFPALTGTIPSITLPAVTPSVIPFTVTSPAPRLPSLAGILVKSMMDATGLSLEELSAVQAALMKGKTNPSVRDVLLKATGSNSLTIRIRQTAINQAEAAFQAARMDSSGVPATIDALLNQSFGSLLYAGGNSNAGLVGDEPPSLSEILLESTVRITGRSSEDLIAVREALLNQAGNPTPMDVILKATGDPSVAETIRETALEQAKAAYQAAGVDGSGVEAEIDALLNDPLAAVFEVLPVDDDKYMALMEEDPTFLVVTLNWENEPQDQDDEDQYVVWYSIDPPIAPSPFYGGTQVGANGSIAYKPKCKVVQASAKLKATKGSMSVTLWRAIPYKNFGSVTANSAVNPNPPGLVGKPPPEKANFGAMIRGGPVGGEYTLGGGWQKGSKSCK